MCVGSKWFRIAFHFIFMRNKNGATPIISAILLFISAHRNHHHPGLPAKAGSLVVEAPVC